MKSIACPTYRLIAAALFLLPAGCTPMGQGLLPGQEEVIEVGTPGEFLTCAQPAAVLRPDTQVIGNAGGELRTGDNRLTIPRGAMASDRRLVFRRQSGDRVGVDVDEAVHFENNRSANLIIDTSHCPDTTMERSWWVWRMGPRGEPSQKLRTLITPARAIAKIDSTSVFMIAN